MKLQLIGMPQAAHRRLKSRFDEWAETLRPEHTIIATPCRNHHVPAIGKPELNDIRAKVRDGFVHLIVVPVRDWELVHKEFRLDCRTTILRFGDSYEEVTWEQVAELIMKSIAFEKRWLHTICPPDLHHALLLPPPCFEPARKLKGYWEKCDVYGNTELLAVAHDVLQSVSAEHRRRKEGQGHGQHGQCWRDCKGRQFTFDPARHAMSPSERAGERRFRFCFQLPVGFHFDVQHEFGTEFTVRDKLGSAYTGRHLNIDPWGSVRGAKALLARQMVAH
jgi:hypothetical protein